MAQNNTLDAETLRKRALAIRIVRSGFADSDLDTVIADGATNGYADGIAYSTATPEV